MTDEPASPSPAPEPALPPERARVEASARQRWDPLPILYLVGFLVLAGTLFFLWRNPPLPAQAQQDAARVQSLQAQVQGLRDQVGQLQSRPAPAPVVVPQPDVQRLQDRLAALESRPAATAPAAPDQGLGQRVEALENRPAADVAPLAGRLDELERQIRDGLGQTTQRIDALERRPQVDLGPLTSRVEQLGTQQQAAVEQLGRRLDGIEARIGAAEADAKQTAADVAAIRNKAELAARLQAASAALASGQKVPAIPGAPPALARFQTEAPPTEASLRQSFDKYAAEADKASQPAIMDNQGFGTRLWNRAQQMVTVRQGDRVLLGDPVAGVIGLARDALDAGDLAGAVKALGGLAGPAAAAMKPWVDQARALLDARAAIASMAAG